METKKQEIVGKVVSAACDKTITVAVISYKKHPLYSKKVISTKKYCVHDENNEAKIGDTVKCVSCRPLSKSKRYTLDKVVEKAVIL
ncbi:MAG: 30S ribosomal protein S17 [Bacilli bacterium]